MNYKDIILALVFLAVFGLFFLSPGLPTKAACGNSIECQIAVILEQIRALQAQLAVLQSQQQQTQPWCYDFYTNFGMGTSNADFGALINVLDREGIAGFNSFNRPAQYDEITAGGVVTLQAKYGILRTGYVGPITRAKLNSLYGCGKIMPPVPVLPIINFTINNQQGPVVSVPSGSYVNLAWSAAHATSCIVSGLPMPIPAAPDTRYLLSGNVRVPVAIDTTFTVTCSNPRGSTSSSITATVSQNQPLSVSYATLINTQPSYAAGQTINFSLKGVATDFQPGTPEKGFNVQSMIMGSSMSGSILVNGVYQSVNANYNYSTGYWDIVMTAPFDNSQTYTVDAAFYCSSPSKGCSGGQINKTFTFTIGSVTQPYISWTEAKNLIETCNVRMVMQLHNLTVHLTLWNNTRLTTVEPVIDEVIRVVQNASLWCGSIPIATE